MPQASDLTENPAGLNGVSEACNANLQAVDKRIVKKDRKMIAKIGESYRKS